MTSQQQEYEEKLRKIFNELMDIQGEFCASLNTLHKHRDNTEALALGIQLIRLVEGLSEAVKAMAFGMAKINRSPDFIEDDELRDIIDKGPEALESMRSMRVSVLNDVQSLLDKIGRSNNENPNYH